MLQQFVKTVNSEAKAAVKCLVLQGKAHTEIHKEVKPVFLDLCPSYVPVKDWCRQFKPGHSNFAEICQDMGEYPQRTVVKMQR